MTLAEFKSSLSLPQAPETSYLLRSLWYDAKNNWHEAHELVDGTDGQDAALIHAYLHRKEGDQWNADYWYRRAGTPRPDMTLDEEWESLVQRFC